MTTCMLPGARCAASPRVWPPGAARPESYEYSCQCDGEAAAELEATACFRAMLEACPAVLAGSRPTPAAARQLGALCHHASDCASGLCHVGRLQRDGVCSAPCMTDADCPSRALCSFAEGAEIGHCFATCSGNDGYFACELLNPAFDDPLNCLDRVDLDDAGLSNVTGESGQICAPLSDGYWPLPVQR